MLWLMDFTRDGRRYHAEVRAPQADTLALPHDLAGCTWFVSVDQPPLETASEDDESAAELQRRLIRCVARR
jgi:hypothetical protein